MPMTTLARPETKCIRNGTSVTPFSEAAWASLSISRRLASKMRSRTGWCWRSGRRRLGIRRCGRCATSTGPGRHRRGQSPRRGSRGRGGRFDFGARQLDAAIHGVRDRVVVASAAVLDHGFVVRGFGLAFGFGHGGARNRRTGHRARPARNAQKRTRTSKGIYSH